MTCFDISSNLSLFQMPEFSIQFQPVIVFITLFGMFLALLVSMSKSFVSFMVLPVFRIFQ